MSNSPIIKVLPRGSGKTKWIIERAYESSHADEKMYFMHKNSEKFIDFIQAYHCRFNEVCKVEYAEDASSVVSGSTVLIDDAVEALCNIVDITVLLNNGCKVVMTMNGTDYTDCTNCSMFNETPDVVQLSFFDDGGLTDEQ